VRAWSLIRESPVYRREAFARGLQKAGFTVSATFPPEKGVERGDVLVIWNRYGQWHDVATRFERQGGTVLVAENGYVGNDRSNRQVYALARDAHNGAGCWYLGGPERWAALSISIAPWREAGDHVLVCPNRSFGMPGFIMPPNWPEAVVEQLKQYTRRPIRLRPHPGNGPPRTPLAADLRNAWAVVIWSSSAGCEALLAGIPVICMAPWWIAKGAAGESLKEVDNPPMPDRMAALEKLAWAQFSVAELESGEPFKLLTAAVTDHV
jgi:hypothetical protein